MMHNGNCDGTVTMPEAGLGGQDITYSCPDPSHQVHEGDRIALVYTGDPYTSLLPGERGTVRFIDSAGTVHVKWDCGSALGLVPGHDQWRVVSDEGDDSAGQAATEQALATAAARKLNQRGAGRAAAWLLRLRQLQQGGMPFDEALATANREQEAQNGK
jgi:hypothetical protein